MGDAGFVQDGFDEYVGARHATVTDLPIQMRNVHNRHPGTLTRIVANFKYF